MKTLIVPWVIFAGLSMAGVGEAQQFQRGIHFPPGLAGRKAAIQQANVKVSCEVTQRGVQFHWISFRRLDVVKLAPEDKLVAAAKKLGAGSWVIYFHADEDGLLLLMAEKADLHALLSKGLEEAER